MRTELQFLQSLKKLSPGQIHIAIEERIDALTKREDHSFFEDVALDNLFKEYIAAWEAEHRKKMTSRRIASRVKMIEYFSDVEMQMRLVQYNLDQLHQGFYMPNELKTELKNRTNGTTKKIGRNTSSSLAQLTERFDYD